MKQNNRGLFKQTFILALVIPWRWIPRHMQIFLDVDIKSTAAH
jgi:hypothetical protein